ncbi:DNA internalization-related competence protein ComEC/Rec2 [Glaciecola siphonariae]|uniref:DNA internalization-related competence protein ComEC/Rec2 n=1 Tax=Glaciecola siphonariae TaxID=521012 RepID=A0ABV9LU08_9ALTE
MLLTFIIIFVSSALWPKLPHLSLLIIGTIALILLCVIKHRSHNCLSAISLGALLGFVWAGFTGHMYISWQIDPQLHNQNLVIEGRVSSVVMTNDEPEDASSQGDPSAIRFNIRLTRAGKSALYTYPKVRLAWYRPSFTPKQGQSLRLLINMRAPNGLANPHSFNYQTWLVSRNIVATGYVLDSPTNKVIKSEVSLRQWGIDELRNIGLSNDAWLQALSFGFRALLTDDDWSLMQASGTAHLFAISGLHVGIVFSYVLFAVAKPLGFLLTVVTRWQSNYAMLTGIIACSACVLYAYLAGFEVPVLRALFALVLWTYLSITQSHWRLSSIILSLLATFFVLFPYAILGVSFWFSFIAVFSIWLFVWRFWPKKTLSRFETFKWGIYLQIWLSFITLPLTFYVFGQVPIFALFANLVLVPWVSIVLVPICVLGTLALLLSLPASIYQTCFYLADAAMNFTLWVMQLTHTLNSDAKQVAASLYDQFFVRGIVAPDAFVSVLLISSILLMLSVLLPFWRGKYWVLSAAMLCLITLHFTDGAYDKSSNGVSRARLAVFDVGQGSASLFEFTDSENEAKLWLFDTGGSYRTGFSMAQSVIVPFIDSELGPKRNIDHLFISHLDNDHAGGINFLLQARRVVKLSSPQHRCSLSTFTPPSTLPNNIKVEVLWPLKPRLGDINADSCVLMLHVNRTRILFAGDIEHQQEQALLELYDTRNKLSADILIAPHHGSRTSSSKPFVTAVSPSIVVFTAAKPNRWGFPDEHVLKRYQKLGTAVLQTGKHGFIEFDLSQKTLEYKSYREHHYPRWYFKAPM